MKKNACNVDKKALEGELLDIIIKVGDIYVAHIYDVP